MKKHAKIRFPFLLVACFFAFNAQSQDSVKVLPPIKIIEFFPVPYQIARLDNASPEYYINQDLLNALGAKDIGDALKYVPGTQIKDYGGVGGIKTIAFRSLGAAHTGVNLDNIPMLNYQVGTINLSSFESFGMGNISFTTGQPSSLFSPATSYIPANQLSIYSKLNNKDTSLNYSVFQRASTVNAFESGLFLSSKVGDHFAVGGQVFAKYGTGQYDYNYDLTGSEEAFTRTNSDILNYKGRFNVSSFWDLGRLNIYYYHNQNQQQLPGAVILYNPSNDQRISNEDNRLDISLMQIFNKWSLGVNAYLHNNHTSYEDPSFLNTQGFLRSSYFQSTAASGFILNRLFGTTNHRAFVGSDAVYSTVESNQFSASPARLQFNSVLGGQFDTRGSGSRWLIQGNVSHQLIFDEARSADTLTRRTYSKFNPFIAVSVKPISGQDLNFRTFYKRVFRMPTFNDLYYNFIGNTNLLPEDAHLVNLGVNWKRSSLSYLHENNGIMLEMGIDGYLNYVQNKIVAVPTKDLFNWSMQNIGQTRAAGFDLTAVYMHQLNKNWLQNMALSFSYNNSVDVTDESSPSYGHQIPYTPVVNGAFSYAIGFKGYQFESNLLYTGERYSLNENIPINQLAPFVDLNLGFSKNWKFNRVHQLYVSIKAMNILNKNYEVIRSFPMPGRHYQFTLTYSFK